jgi:hypothetical protein
VALVFPKGSYDFFAGSNPQNKGTLFPVADMQGLTIDGKGSEFTIHGLTSVFWFGNCRELTIKDLTIDWDRPPYSMGRVVAAEGNHFDVEVQPEYPVKGGSRSGHSWTTTPRRGCPPVTGWTSTIPWRRRNSCASRCCAST